MAVCLALPKLDRSRPQSVNAMTHCSYGHRKRVHRTPAGATEGNITVVTIIGNCLVRWRHVGLRHRLLHYAKSKRGRFPSPVSRVASQSMQQNHVIVIVRDTASPESFTNLIPQTIRKMEASHRPPIHLLLHRHPPLQYGECGKNSAILTSRCPLQLWIGIPKPKY